MMSNEQTRELLRTADPAAGLSLDSDVAERLLARAQSGKQVRTTRSRKRLAAGTIVAAALLATAGTAAAAGLLPAPVQEAFSAGHVGSPDPSTGADASSAVQLASGSGPEGSTLSVWTAPLQGTSGRCIALVGSVRGAPFMKGKPDVESAACSGGEAFPTAPMDAMTSEYWIAPQTRNAYYRFAGITGGAAQITLHVDDKKPVVLSQQNGWFVGYVPAHTEGKKPFLVATDATGNKIATKNI